MATLSCLQKQESIISLYISQRYLKHYVHGLIFKDVTIIQLALHQNFPKKHEFQFYLFDPTVALNFNQANIKIFVVSGNQSIISLYIKDSYKPKSRKRILCTTVSM